MEVIDKVGGDTESSHMELHKLFNEQGYSDYVVVYLRLITSGQLQRDADFYQHFIEGERTISEFCHQVRMMLISDQSFYVDIYYSILILFTFILKVYLYLLHFCFLGSRTNV